MAAGGLQDGRGLVAALAFGAAGVAMGTRFVLTDGEPGSRRHDWSASSTASVNDILVTSQIDGCRSG